MRYIATLILFCLTIPAIAQISVDKNMAIDFTNRTKAYEQSRKSKTPNKAVVFISNKVNPKYMDLEEVSIDSNDVSDGRIVINRPTSSFKRPLIDCKSEMIGVVTFNDNSITVPTTSLPVRVLCYGENGNYREAYTTIQK